MFDDMIIDANKKKEYASDNVKGNVDDGRKKLSIAHEYLKNTIKDTKREAKKLGWLETMKVNMQDGKYNSIFGSDKIPDLLLLWAAPGPTKKKVRITPRT